MSVRDNEMLLLLKFPGISVPDSVCMDAMHMLFLREAKRHIQYLHDYLRRLRPNSEEESRNWDINFTNFFNDFSRQNRNSVRANYVRQKISLKPAFTIQKHLIWGPKIYRLTGDFPAQTNNTELHRNALLF